MEKPVRSCEINEKITSKLEEMIQNERITTRITERLNVSKGTLHTLLATSGIIKLFSRFVLCLLTAEMQARRLQCCHMNLQTLENVGKRMLHNIFTMDETPLSVYIPDSKRDSQEWKLRDQTNLKKMEVSTVHKIAPIPSISGMQVV